MVVVRCTKKLLSLLGREVVLTEQPPSVDDWYANLLWIDRRKCLLLVHADTLFPVFRTDVRAGDLRPLGPFVVRLVEDELQAEGFPHGSGKARRSSSWRALWAMASSVI